jgi:predicted ribosome-associated RNA-binding protein Tma20
VSVQDILPQDKIKELGEAFKHYKEESLTAMKEVWDKYSWDELRMFKSKFELILKSGDLLFFQK